MLLNSIDSKISDKKKLFSLLIDPDKYTREELIKTVKIAEAGKVDYVFTGSSLISKNLDETIRIIKNECSIPVILFPGSCFQISEIADGILFLSLISGRNPEYLIGSHVVAAPLLKNSSLEVLPTGYMLIKGKNITSVEYMSNTIPIPADKNDIIIATAQAGEMLGLKLIYLEAGSGAFEPIKPEIISSVKSSIQLPLIVGGGIKSGESLKAVLHAGADMVVIGNAIEHDKSILQDLIFVTKSF